MAATEISVDHIARVEGHGDIRLVIEDGQVTTCEMAVVEPARLFESMVRGRSLVPTAMVVVVGSRTVC